MAEGLSISELLHSYLDQRLACNHEGSECWSDPTIYSVKTLDHD